MQILASQLPFLIYQAGKIPTLAAHSAAVALRKQPVSHIAGGNEKWCNSMMGNLVTYSNITKEINS